MIRNCDYDHIKRLSIFYHLQLLFESQLKSSFSAKQTCGLSVPHIKINAYLRMLCKIKEALSPSMEKKLRLKQFMVIKDD